MAIDNRTIEVKKINEIFTILVKREGIKKFVDKNWFSKNHINCTVLIDKAKQFNSYNSALSFWEDIKGLDDEVSIVDIIKMQIQFSVDI